MDNNNSNETNNQNYNNNYQSLNTNVYQNQNVVQNTNISGQSFVEKMQTASNIEHTTNQTNIKTEIFSNDSFENTIHKNKKSKKITIGLIIGVAIITVTAIILVPKLIFDNNITISHENSTRDGSPKYESKILKLLENKIYSELGGKIDNMMYSKSIGEDFIVYADGIVHVTSDAVASEDVRWRKFPIGKNKKLLIFDVYDGVYANNDGSITAFIQKGSLSDDGTSEIIHINTKQTISQFVTGFGGVDGKYNIIYKEGKNLMYAVYSSDSSIIDSGKLYGVVPGQELIELSDVSLTTTGILATTKDGRVYVGSKIISNDYFNQNALNLTLKYITDANKCFGEVWSKILVSSGNNLRLYDNPIFGFDEITEYTTINLPNDLSINDLIKVDKNIFLFKDKYYLLSGEDVKTLTLDDTHISIARMEGFVKFLNNWITNKTIVLMDDGYLYVLQQ